MLAKRNAVGAFFRAIGVGPGHPLGEQPRTLAPQAHGEALLLRDLGEDAVDLLGLSARRRSSSRRRWAPSGASQEVDGQVDVVHVRLWEGVVDQVDTLEKRGGLPGLDLLLQDDVDSLLLALDDVLRPSRLRS